MKAIIFDMFGVICSEVTPPWFQERFPEDEAQRLKNAYVSQVDRGEISDEELLERLSQLTGEAPDAIWSELLEKSRINQAVVAMITEYRKLYKIGLCTDSGSRFVRTILEHNNLVELFNAIVISSEVKITKPDPRIYHLILDKLGVSAVEAVFIDDHSSNLVGAESVGMKAILFSGALALRQGLVSFTKQKET